MVPSILLDDITAPMLSDRLQGRGFPVVATSAVLGSLIENLILNTHADIIWSEQLLDLESALFQILLFQSHELLNLSLECRNNHISAMPFDRFC